MKKFSLITKSFFIIVALLVLTGGIILLVNPFSKKDKTEASTNFNFIVKTVAYREGTSSIADYTSTSIVGSSLFDVSWYEDEKTGDGDRMPFDATLYYNGTSRSGNNVIKLNNISTFYYHYSNGGLHYVRRHGRINITNYYPSWWRCHGVYDSSDAAGSPLSGNTTYYKWASNAPSTSSPPKGAAEKTMYGNCYVIYRWYYNLAFNANGGSNAPSSINFYSGLGGVTIPSSTPTRSGYKFKGWSRSSSATNASYASGDNFKDTTGDAARTINLYAVWEPLKYTVTLDRQSGSGGDGSVTATYNSSMPTISVPSRAGYTFQGYYSSTGGSGTKYYNSNGTSARAWDNASDKTLYAYWTANEYTVTLDRQSGSGGDGSVTATYDSLMPSISVPSRTGYTFNGYYSGTNGSGTKYYNSNGTPYNSKVYRDFANRTLYAYWTPKTSSITLNKYDGSGGSSSITATYDSPMPQITVPTKYGYDFGGYYWLQNGGGTQYYNSNGVSVHNWDRDTSSTTLEAYWIPKSSNIVYLPNGGSGTMTTEGNKYFYGQPTALTLNTYYRTGYSFVGWHWQQTLILDKSKISDSYDLATQKAKVTHADGAKFTVSNESDEQSLYAIWRNNKYYVKYNGNVEGQGVGGNCQSSDPVTGSMSNSTHYYNISSNLTDNGYSRRGYTFLGWSTNSSATSTSYSNQGQISTLTSTDNATVNLYAIWQRNTYTITFNANGGSGTTSSLSMLYNNGNYTLPKSGYSKAGYVFEGWTTNLDGTGTFYKDGATVNSYDFVANTILYAKWRATWITSASSSILGSGTQSNPYIISKAEDLAYLAKQVQKGETYSSGSTRKYFEQTAPINLTGKIWLPIGGNSLGEATTAFGGVYNGRGFAIIGLETYNQTDASGNQLYNNVGLFGRTNGARLENVNISNAKIYGKTNVSALVGENYDKPLEMYGCFARGEINGSTNVGGLLGKDSISGSQISNSGFAGNVTNGSIIAGTMVGGIVKNSYAEVTTDIPFVGNGATIDACVFSANGNKQYYDDKSPDDGYFRDWTTYEGKPLPSGLTWIGGVESGPVSLDGYTKIG